MLRPLTRRSFLVLAGATAGALALPRLALADDNSTPDKATPITQDGAISGALPGGPGGRFAYYKFTSPGGWPVHIDMNPNRNLDDVTFLRAVGWKLYGPDPDRVYMEGKLDDDKVWQGANDLNSIDQGVYLIQVYNYLPVDTAVLNYTLTVTNLPPQTQPNGAPANTTAPDGAFGYTAIPLDGKQSGTLDAGAGGHFRYYKFWATAGTTIGVDAEITPDDVGILATAGYKLYGPTNGRTYLQSQAQKGKTPNQTGDLFVPDNGEYVLQMYNYSPTTPITYTVWTRGPVYLK